MSSIPFALTLHMSRVEPKETPPKRELKEDRKPSQAEGDEQTVDEALSRNESGTREPDTARRPED